MIKTAQEFIEDKVEKFAKMDSFKTKDIRYPKKKRTWKREKYTFMVQSNNPEKVFIIERNILQDQDKGLEERTPIGLTQYRIGYFIVGKQGNRNGKWTWGQYCPNIPVEDFWKLIKKAQKEGTILKERQKS